ncbi:nuclear transport factor 2 family protein [Chryseobacterium sp. Bi04]|uniref:nuclear transport factor 2 family protein n=1 Tax=Chryseobacterium sp. Bi04 TaxID=2822345 RepID=UPI001D7A1AC0|nr:nuclear transport factor 2 family protein [Chryseobacterium sp. Bi04]CAH0194020.1 hypothetical protein SRABI04_01811 [Chryseobacterium sp. Bi04]
MITIRLKNFSKLFLSVFTLLAMALISFSCDNSNDEEITQKVVDNNLANMEVVKKNYAAFGAGDIPGVQAVVSENTVWIYHGAPPIPYTGTYNGKEGVKTFINNIINNVKVLNFKVDKMVAGENNTVIVTGEETQEINSNKKILTQKWIHVYTVENGLITKLEEFANTAAAVEAFQN